MNTARNRTVTTGKRKEIQNIGRPDSRLVTRVE